MKHTFLIFAFAFFLLSCSDESDRLACEKATAELADAEQALRLFEMHAPPSICSSPCTVQQTYQIERTKLVRMVTDYKSAKLKACN